MRSFLLVAALVIVGCSNPDSPKDVPAQKPEPAPPTVPTTPSTGPQNPTPEERVDFVMQWQLLLVDQSQTDLVSYEEVRGLLEADCVFCHTSISPKLDSFPFEHDSLTNQQDIVSGIIDRMNHESRPMPPQGMLPAEKRQLVQSWLDSNLMTEPVPSADPSGYAIQWTFDGKIEQASLVGGQAKLLMKNQLVGHLVDVDIEVIGPKGTVVLTKSMKKIEIESDGSREFSLKAVPEDHMAPVPSAEINATEDYTGNLRINWSPAVDNSKDPLRYAVFSRTGIWGALDPAKVVALSEIEVDWQEGLFKTDLKRQAEFTVYVVVKDKVGNMAAYAPLIFSSDHHAPVPGLLKVEDVTATELQISWSPAVDNIATSNLSYQVLTANDDLFSDIESAATAVRASGIMPNQFAITLQGLQPGREYYVSVEVQDPSGNKALYKAIKVAAAEEDHEARYGINQHGQECAARLGYLKPFSCLDGEIIPIEVGGKVPEHGYPEFAAGGSRQLDCDKPALLGLGRDGRCAPYARLGKLDSYDKQGRVLKDVDTVFICRRYIGRFGEAEWQGQIYPAEEFPGFEDVAIIQHNAKTGESCYFQMLADDSKDGRRVPPPTEASLPENAPQYALSADDFWLSPRATANINCNSCHDADPWIHSPYVDQVRGEDGRALVPSSPFSKYSVIGSRFFTRWRDIESVSTETGDNQCTECHRIGRSTCSTFGRQSVGVSLPQNLSEFARNSFRHTHWMPPAERNVGSQEEFDRDEQGLLSDWQEIDRCCSNPNAEGCVGEPIKTAPPLFSE